MSGKGKRRRATGNQTSARALAKHASRTESERLAYFASASPLLQEARGTERHVSDTLDSLLTQDDPFKPGEP